MPETKCGFVDLNGIKAQDALEMHGPTLLVDIGFDAAYEALNRVGRPTLAESKLWALVDTGATESCIDNDLALKLNLPVVDRRQISGVSGLKEVNMYLAHIYIASLSFTLYGMFAGVDLVAGGQRHYALIGRTFLRHFKMTYDGITGDVTLSS